MPHDFCGKLQLASIAPGCTVEVTGVVQAEKQAKEEGERHGEEQSEAFVHWTHDGGA